MKTAALTLVLLLAPAPLFAGADEDYKAIANSMPHERLPLIEAFLEAFPKDNRVQDLLETGADLACKLREYERAEPMLRRLLKDFAEEINVGRTRHLLCEVLSQSRKLDDLIALCDENLTLFPKAGYRSDWMFFKAEALFRLWRFKEAEAALNAIYEEDRPPKGSIEYYLGRINPKLTADANGVLEGYNGKFAKDVRFKRVLARLPELLKSARATLKDTLGVDVPQNIDTYLEFRDWSADSGGDRAVSSTLCLDYKPATQITFYTEFIVLDPEDFAQRLTHELKHAAFRKLMGQKYLALPQWLQEGLAVYGARQTDDRVAWLLSSAAAGRGDPLQILNGVDEPNGRHNSYDYLEDAVCFEWLESLKAGNVHAFCKSLLAGQDYKAIFAALSGKAFNDAMTAAAAFCRKRAEAALGADSRQGLDLANSGPPGLIDLDNPRGWEKWFKQEGQEKFEKWLAANPKSVLAPKIRLHLGHGLVLSGKHEEGRKLLEQVRDQDKRRCGDAARAQELVAKSYDLAKDNESAKREYGVYLRDYCWADWRALESIKRKYESAPPVTEEDDKKPK